MMSCHCDRMSKCAENALSPKRSRETFTPMGRNELATWVTSLLNFLLQLLCTIQLYLGR